jgi:hypothetical protein
MPNEFSKSTIAKIPLIAGKENNRQNVVSQAFGTWPYRDESLSGQRIYSFTLRFKIGVLGRCFGDRFVGAAQNGMQILSLLYAMQQDKRQKGIT